MRVVCISGIRKKGAEILTQLFYFLPHSYGDILLCIKYTNTTTQIYLDEDENNDAPKEWITYNDEQLADTIDQLLKSMDLDKDGFIDYTEYKNNL